MSETIISGAPPKEGYKVESGLSIPYHDYISVAYPDSTTEVYTFKRGGSTGGIVSTTTITYTDSSRNSINTVARL